MEKPTTLQTTCEEPARVAVLMNFNSFTRAEMDSFRIDNGLAMDLEDLLFCQKYFQEENRPPTITEIKVLDTYWSDHCRHTTFMTEIEDVEIAPGVYNQPIQTAYDRYMEVRDQIYGNKTERPVTLMDIAVVGMKKLRSEAPSACYR